MVQNYDTQDALQHSHNTSNLTLSHNAKMQTSNMVYFDYNATTPLHPKCFDAMLEVFNIPANPSSIHYWGQKARGFIERSRYQVAQSLDIPLRDSNGYVCIFVSSGTEANNMVLNSFMRTYNPGTIITSAIEHSSVLNCAKEYINTQIVRVDEDGIIDLVHLENILENHKGTPLLISIMLANNETGVIQPIEDIVSIAKKYNAWVHSDCCQAFGKISFNVTNINLDFVTISSHKIGGPNGAAAVIAKSQHFLVPHLLGGKQEKGMRAGTENVAAVAGFGQAAMLATDALSKNCSIYVLKEYLENTLTKTHDKVKIFGKNAPRLNNTTMIMMPNVASQQQILDFDNNGFAVSAGSACSSGQISVSHVLTAMKVPENEAQCAIRISIGPYNTKDQIEKFCKLWQQKCIQHNSNTSIH